LMAGSLYALWPYKSQYSPKNGPMELQGIGDDAVLVGASAIAGGAVVWLLALLERRITGIEQVGSAADGSGSADRPAMSAD
ncbi:MAG: DUF368 domain-containing protein, partial [Myxococcota bacterium]